MRQLPLLAAIAAGAVLAGSATLPAFAQAPARSASAPGSCAWSWSPLPLPADRIAARVNGASGHGQYAGTDNEVGLIWRDGKVAVAGSAFGLNTELWDVNSSGVAVGSALSGFTGSIPVRYRDRKFEALPVPDGANAHAVHINERGDIVGSINYGRLILWPADAPGTYKLLTGPFHGYADVVGIADDGTVAAWAVVESTQPEASFLWSPDGTWTRLESAVPDADTKVSAIRGDKVVGASSYDTVIEWDRAGRIVRTYPNGWARNVNSAGQVLGYARGEERSTPAIWRDGALERLLPDHQGKVVAPVAIDEDGRVVGHHDSLYPMTGHCAG